MRIGSRREPGRGLGRPGTNGQVTETMLTMTKHDIAPSKRRRWGSSLAAHPRGGEAQGGGPRDP